MRILFSVFAVSVVMCVSFLYLFSCDSAQRSSKSGADARPSKLQIADQMESAIRRAQYIEFTEHSTQEKTDPADTRQVLSGTEPLTVKGFMTLGRFKTEVYDKSGLLMHISLADGVMEEFVRGNPIAAYKAPYPNGTDNLKLESPFSCRVGGDIFSWIVTYPNDLQRVMDRAATMRVKIEKGVQLPDEEVRGHDCYVFCQEIVVDDKNTVKHIVQVDKYSFHIVGWSTSQPGVVRSRAYEINTFDKVPVDISWRNIGEPTNTANK